MVRPKIVQGVVDPRLDDVDTLGKGNKRGRITKGKSWFPTNKLVKCLA